MCGCREFYIAEFDIKESAIAKFDITEFAIAEFGITVRLDNTEIAIAEFDTTEFRYISDPAIQNSVHPQIIPYFTGADSAI